MAFLLPLLGSLLAGSGLRMGGGKGKKAMKALGIKSKPRRARSNSHMSSIINSVISKSKRTQRPYVSLKSNVSLFCLCFFSF